MKYVIDRIEGDIVVAIEQDTKKVIKIDRSLINCDIYEGLILDYKDGNYTPNEEETKLTELEVKSRFDKLKE